MGKDNSKSINYSMSKQYYYIGTKCTLPVNTAN